MGVREGCAPRVVLWGTTAEVGSEDMDTTCGEVLLCTQMSVMSVSTVSKICPPLFPWDAVSSGELSILQSSLGDGSSLVGQGLKTFLLKH